MNILMMTNTYFPMVGGLEQSVHSFSEEFKSLGHEVLIVTPAFGGAPQEESGVIRIPAFDITSRSPQLMPDLLITFISAQLTPAFDITSRSFQLIPAFDITLISDQLTPPSESACDIH